VGCEEGTKQPFHLKGNPPSVPQAAEATSSSWDKMSSSSMAMAPAELLTVLLLLWDVAFVAADKALTCSLVLALAQGGGNNTSGRVKGGAPPGP